MRIVFCAAALALLGACAPLYEIEEPYSYVDSVRLDDGTSRSHAVLIEDYNACNSYSVAQMMQALNTPTEGTYRLDTTPSPNRGRNPDFLPRVNDIDRNTVNDSVPTINHAMASRARTNRAGAVREQTYISCMANAGWIACYSEGNCAEVEKVVLTRKHGG